VAQDRFQWWALANTVASHWVPQNAGNFLINLGTTPFSRTLLRIVSGTCTAINRKILLGLNYDFVNSVRIHCYTQLKCVTVQLFLPLESLGASKRNEITKQRVVNSLF